MPIVAALPALISTGGSIAGGILGNKASDAQAQSLQQALDSLKGIYNTNVGNSTPFLNNGTNANNNLAYLLGLGDPNQAGQTGQFGSLAHDFGANDFQADPGYLFRLGEGQKALERSAAAKGTTFSGGTLKALDRYNQGFASNEYQNAFQRYNQNRQLKYGFLSGLSGQGLNALGNITNSGDHYADAAASLYGDIGKARASGYTSTANAITGGLTGLGEMFMKPKVGG